ncbi:MAG: type III-A CRISPR-associated RAMP protein Csm3 [bacterium]
MEQLIKKILIEGTIKLKTGMHIGGTFSAMGIGGPDSTIIRSPLDNKPLIPGSSLKGKMRSLIELSDGTIREVNMNNVKYGPTDDPEAPASKLFGTASGEKQIPARLIVRDSELISDENEFSNMDLPFTESKTEVVLDRITASAMPRQIERVPAGSEFALNMVLNIYKDDNNENELVRNTIRGLKLVKDDYLGGNGSRGYGQVVFYITDIKSRSMEYYKGEAEEESILDKYKDKLDGLKD